MLEALKLSYGFILAEGFLYSLYLVFVVLRSDFLSFLV